MGKTTFFVLSENTFGYTFDSADKDFVRLNVMAVDYMRGGDPLLLHNQVIAHANNRRLASIEDFKHFRISVDGYLSDENYVFIR